MDRDIIDTFSKGFLISLDRHILEPICEHFNIKYNLNISSKDLLILFDDSRDPQSPELPFLVKNRRKTRRLEKIVDEFVFSKARLKPIDNFPNFYSLDTLNFIFNENRSVVGQWNEENKMVSLTPSSISLARMLNIPIEKYDFDE